MKRPGVWICLGAAAVLGLAACSGDGGGEDVLPDSGVPDAVADVSQDDPGTGDLPGDNGADDPGESPDTVEPEDPGTLPDATPTDVTGLDAESDVPKPASRGCIGCHTDQAILEVLAPDDGTEPEGGGG